MTETEPAPPEEPDTPEEEVRVTFPQLVTWAAELAFVVAERKRLEKQEENLRKAILDKWVQMPNLHGIRLENGDAVRKTWSVRASTKIDPARLRELMKDAPDYIVESVDMPKLKAAYPSVWEQAGHVKRKETIAVRLAGEKNGEGGGA